MSKATQSVFRRDAEAAGRYTANFINPKRKADRGASTDVIYVLAVWAFHWAFTALEQEYDAS